MRPHDRLLVGRSVCLLLGWSVVIISQINDILHTYKLQWPYGHKKNHKHGIVPYLFYKLQEVLNKDAMYLSVKFLFNGIGFKKERAITD